MGSDTLAKSKRKVIAIYIRRGKALICKPKRRSRAITLQGRTLHNFTILKINKFDYG